MFVGRKLTFQYNTRQDKTPGSKMFRKKREWGNGSNKAYEITDNGNI